MTTLCSVSATNMRNSHGVCVKKTTEQTGMVRPKTKQPKVSAIALLIVGIIVFGRGEQTLSAQTENISIAAAIPCPLFVPTSVTRDRDTDLPDTAEPAPNNAVEEPAANRPASVPIDSLPLTVTELTPMLYLINGEENIAVFVDDNDVLLIGSAATNRREELRACISSITELPVKYIIGTHQHDNQLANINTLPRLGPDALTIAHENTQALMLDSGQRNSVDLVFTANTTLFLDNSRVELQHFANSHTDSDIVVLITNDRVLHAGDLFTDGYPIIDYASGGSSQGWIEALDGMLALNFEMIIPGRGPVMTRTDVQLFRDWFVTVRTRVRQLIDRDVPQWRVARELIMEDLTRPLEDNRFFLRRTLPNLYDELVEARLQEFSAPQPTKPSSRGRQTPCN